jgi:hypothetical protein
MTLEPIDPHPLSISDKAKRVMQAAANAKRKPARQRTAKPALSLTEQLYRKKVRQELLAGGNPLLHDPAFVAELAQASEALTRALDDWQDRWSDW